MLSKENYTLEQALAELHRQAQNYIDEKQLRELVTIYAGIMAHDQRTPIAKLMMMSDFLQKFAAQINDIYYDAQAHNLKCTQLIKKADFNYFNSAIKELQYCAQTMNHITSNSLENLAQAIKLHNGEIKDFHFIKCNIKANLHLDKLQFPLWEGEEHLLKLDTKYKFSYLGNSLTVDQIIANLISNALYQIRELGTGKIYIRTKEYSTINKLYIKDTAGGITPDSLANLFQAGYTTKPNGTGRGLAFCKTMMQLFGGDIKAYLVDDKFIEFELAFPKL